MYGSIFPCGWDLRICSWRCLSKMLGCLVIGMFHFLLQHLFTNMQLSLITIHKGGKLSVIMNFHNLLMLFFVFLCFSKFFIVWKGYLCFFGGWYTSFIFMIWINYKQFLYDRYIYDIICYIKVHNFVL